MRGAEIFDIPIGLQLPKPTSSGRIAIELHGEIVASAQLQPGFDHRGVERAAERRNWTDIPSLLGHIFGICPHAHAMAYCLGVERLAGIEAPPRAQSIRILVAELERVHNHLLWFGALAYQAGLVSLLVECWHDREIVMDMLEMLSGKRLDYSACRLGGVKYDLTADLPAEIQRRIDSLEIKIRRYLHLVLTDPFLQKRTQGVGVTTRSQAEKLGLVGPTAALEFSAFRTWSVIKFGVSGAR